MFDDGDDKESTPEVTVIGSREEDNKTPVPQMAGDDGDVSMMDVGEVTIATEVSQGVPGTMDNLHPVALPQDSNNSPKSPKMSFDEFGPDSVPHMPTSGFGFPARKVDVPSPNKAKTEEKAVVEPTETVKEAEPTTAPAILPDVSHSVSETLDSLEPGALPEKSNKTKESPQRPFDEFGPDSVPQMSSSSFGFPASRGGHLSPNKDKTEEKTAEVPTEWEPLSATAATVLPEVSQGVPETKESLGPVSLPKESDNSSKSTHKSFDEFGPDSLPPMPSSGFGFPASKVSAPSPKKAELEEKTVVEPTESEKEVEPLTATAIILPEFEGEEMIGDGELPDLVKVVLGKDSTPDFEEEERKLMVEEKGPKGESIPVTCAVSPVADVAPMVTPTKSPKRAAPVIHATPRNSMADFRDQLYKDRSSRKTDSQ